MIVWHYRNAATGAASPVIRSSPQRRSAAPRTNPLCMTPAFTSKISPSVRIAHDLGSVRTGGVHRSRQGMLQAGDIDIIKQCAVPFRINLIASRVVGAIV